MKKIMILCLLVSCQFLINASPLIYDSYTSMRPSRFSESEIFLLIFPDDVGFRIRDSSLPGAYSNGTERYTIYEYMNYSNTEPFRCTINSNSMQFTEHQTTNNSEDNTDWCTYLLDAGAFTTTLSNCNPSFSFQITITNVQEADGWDGNMFVETFILSTQNVSETVNLPTDFYYKIYVEMIGTGHTNATFEFSGSKFISHNPIITFFEPLLEGDSESLEQVDEFVDNIPKKEKEFSINPNNIPTGQYFGYAIVKVNMMNSGIGTITYNNYNNDYIEFRYPALSFDMNNYDDYQLPINGLYDTRPHSSSDFFFPDPFLICNCEYSWEQQKLYTLLPILQIQPYPNTICFPIKISRVYNCHNYAWFLPIGPSTDSDVSIWSQNRTPRIWVNTVNNSLAGFESQGLIQMDDWNDDVKVVLYHDSGFSLHSAKVDTYDSAFTSSYLKSKWGDGYLRIHHPQDVPPSYNYSGENSVILFGNISLTDNADNSEMYPLTNEIIGNYPNPFNPTTIISYTLDDKAIKPQLKIFNVKGQLVKKIQLLALPGIHKLQWSGKNNDGSYVSSGMYFYSLLNDGKIVDTKKMTLMK